MSNSCPYCWFNTASVLKGWVTLKLKSSLYQSSGPICFFFQLAPVEVAASWTWSCWLEGLCVSKDVMLMYSGYSRETFLSEGDFLGLLWLLDLFLICLVSTSPGWRESVAKEVQLRLSLEPAVKIFSLWSHFWQPAENLCVRKRMGSRRKR